MSTGGAFGGVLEAARSGENEAWRTIYRQLAPVVRGYLRGRGEREPDDLIGEIFLQVVRDVHAFQGGEREFRAWVLSIAHHRLLDERRRRRRHPVQVVHALLAAEEVGGDVEEETMARMGDGRVRTALSRLPSAQRSVIMLRVIGDLSVEEVARVNGKTPGAVKQLQRRALITLKRELGTVTVTP